MNCSEISFFCEFWLKKSKNHNKKVFYGRVWEVQKRRLCRRYFHVIRFAKMSRFYWMKLFLFWNRDVFTDSTTWKYLLHKLYWELSYCLRFFSKFYQNSSWRYLIFFQMWIFAKIAFFVSSFVPLVELKIKIRKFLKRKNILSQDGEILQWTFVGGRSDHLVKRFMSHWLDINWVITQQKLTQHCWMYHQGKSVGVKRGVKVGVNK